MNIDLSDIESGDGSNGIIVTGAQAGDYSGLAISSAGDINGDGFDDFVIGAYGEDTTDTDAGASYLVYGGTGLVNLSLADIEGGDGSQGFVIYGAELDDFSGYTVSAAGDVNNDGYDDFLIGARGEDTGGGEAGATYLIYGGSGLSDINLADIESGGGADGIAIYGNDASDEAGRALAAAGDVNGDGYDDFIVGSYGEDTGGSAAGATYVLFGGAGLTNFDLQQVELGIGGHGIMIYGGEANDFSGYSVSSAGDLNGDGYDDILIGAYGEDSGGGASGAYYVVYGAASLVNIDLTAMEAADGSKGYFAVGAEVGDKAGYSVSSAGDVNGDGYDDLVVGALYEDTGGLSAGASYVIYGGDNTGDVIEGTVGDDALVADGGAGAGDSLVGGLGDDTLTSDGGGDVLYGGYGDDTFIIDTTDFFRLEGGGGADSLRLDGTDLDLTAINNNNLSGLETVDLATDGGANALTLDIMDLIDMTDSDDRLVVMGDGSDSLTFAASAILAVTDVIGTENIDGQDYDVYTFSNGDGDVVGTLLVDQDMSVTI